MRLPIILSLLALCLSACSATSYVPRSSGDGYMEEEVGPNVWRVSFFGNGHTTGETVQTYWLYRCAELTRQHGFEGFEIISPLVLSERDPYEEIKVAGGHYVAPIIVYTGPPAPTPTVIAEIKLLRKPVKPMARKIFVASTLLLELEKVVKGPKCSKGNVCPYAHQYLDPEYIPPAPVG